LIILTHLKTFLIYFSYSNYEVLCSLRLPTRPSDDKLNLSKDTKVLLMALDYPFKKLHGVELSDKLVQEAEENLENYCAKKKKNHIASIYLGDARFYQIPPTATVFFFYNPFTWSIFEHVAENIQESLRRHPRETRLIYINDLHWKELEKKEMQCVSRGSEFRINYSVWNPLVV